MLSMCIRSRGLVSRCRIRSFVAALALGSFLHAPGSTQDPPSPLHPDLVTYWGGEGADGINDVSIDRVNGEEVITMVGVTSPGSFSFLGETMLPGEADAFVTRLGMDGREIWSTILGGPGVDAAWALDVDADGRIAVVGWADADFPTTDGALRSEGIGLDAFVALLSKDGEVLYSATLGGAGEDVAMTVVFDEGGAILLAGYTGSRDFPATPGGFQVSHGGGTYDEFVARLVPDAALPTVVQLPYATYLGGAGNEAWCCRFMDRMGVTRMTLLSHGKALIVGHTESMDFPRTEAPIGPAGLGNADVHVTVLDCDPSLEPDAQLRLSFLIGGSGYDEPGALVLEDAQTAVIGGLTNSGNFPTTPGAIRTSHPNPGGDSDTFVVRLRLQEGLPAVERLTYGTLLPGGTGNDFPYSMAMLEAGIVLVAGMTLSPTFEGREGPMAVGGMADGFLDIIVLDATLPAGEQLVSSELFGGGGMEQLTAVSTFASGGTTRIATVGVSGSSDLGVTPGAPKETMQGDYDGCLAIYTSQLSRAVFTVSPDVGQVPLTVGVDAGGSRTPAGTTIASYAWDFGDGATGEGVTATHTYEKAGRFALTLAVTNSAGIEANATRSVTVAFPPGDVSPWNSADIGSPRFPGSSWKEGDCIQIRAGGQLISGTSDGLHFVYREFAGDFVSTARIEEIDGAPSAQVGLMARADTDPGAVLTAIGINRSSTTANFRFFSRKTTGGSSAIRPGQKAALPAWVRLQREGDDLIGYSSPDNITWKEVGRMSLPESPEQLLVGMFGVGQDPATAISFEPLEARLCLEEIPIPTFIRGDSNADRATDISDAVAILGFLFLGETGVPCEQAGDANDDGALDISDAVFLLGFLFLGGEALPPPVGTCGVDPTGHDLPCDSFPGCP